MSSLMSNMDGLSYLLLLELPLYVYRELFFISLADSLRSFRNEQDKMKRPQKNLLRFMKDASTKQIQDLELSQAIRGLFTISTHVQHDIAK